MRNRRWIKEINKMKKKEISNRSELNYRQEKPQIDGERERVFHKSKRVAKKDDLCD